jgi:hypothetical protein
VWKAKNKSVRNFRKQSASVTKGKKLGASTEIAFTQHQSEHAVLITSIGAARIESIRARANDAIRRGFPVPDGPSTLQVGVLKSARSSTAAAYTHSSTTSEVNSVQTTFGGLNFDSF